MVQRTLTHVYTTGLGLYRDLRETKARSYQHWQACLLCIPLSSHAAVTDTASSRNSRRVESPGVKIASVELRLSVKKVQAMTQGEVAVAGLAKPET